MENQQLEVIKFRELPEFQGAKEKQEALLAENPYITITCPKEAVTAKANRTALKTGRTELQKGEKLIKSKVRDFVKTVADETQKLINITLEAENKQQAEIDRYDNEQKAKKEEARIKAEAKAKELKAKLDKFVSDKENSIETATIVTIESIIEDIEQSDLELDELHLDFLEAQGRLLSKAQTKHTSLAQEAQKAEEERRMKKMYEIGLSYNGQSFIHQDINFHWTDLRCMSVEEFDKACDGAIARMKVLKKEEAEAAKIQAAKEAEELKAKQAEEAKTKEEAELKEQLGKERSAILKNIDVLLSADACANMTEEVWIDYLQTKEKLFQSEQSRKELEKQEADRKAKELEKLHLSRRNELLELGFIPTEIGFEIVELNVVVTTQQMKAENFSIDDVKKAKTNSEEKLEAIRPDKEKFRTMVDNITIDDVKFNTPEILKVYSELSNKLEELKREFKGRIAYL